jgi:addiction module HigA family antidote
MIFNPAHPGEVLRDYLGEMSIAEAAQRLGVTRAHLSRIVNGRAGISAAMSLRLSAALGTSPEFWLKMQLQYDLWQAKQSKTPRVRPFPRVRNRDSATAERSGKTAADER